MQIPTKKLNNGFEFPVYGLGTWKMGGKRERDLQNHDEADIHAIQSAIEHGVKHIDTAELYAGGHTEELIGQAIRSYDRAQLFLSSKVAPSNLTREGVINSCHDTLQRLGTTYLDLYLVHAPNESIPLEETMSALDELKAQGLIREIGVSNFSKETLATAQRLTQNKIVCNQVHYNLITREAEKTGLLQYCQDNDIFLVAYRPIERGQILAPENWLMKELSEKYKKTFAQIAINWLISQPLVTVIAKTRTLTHLEENLGALDWQLEQKDVERLRKEYPNQLAISDTTPLT